MGSADKQPHYLPPLLGRREEESKAKRKLQQMENIFKVIS